MCMVIKAECGSWLVCEIALLRRGFWIKHFFTKALCTSIQKCIVKINFLKMLWAKLIQNDFGICWTHSVILFFINSSEDYIVKCFIWGIPNFRLYFKGGQNVICEWFVSYCLCWLNLSLSSSTWNKLFLISTSMNGCTSVYVCSKHALSEPGGTTTFVRYCQHLCLCCEYTGKRKAKIGEENCFQMLWS